MSVPRWVSCWTLTVPWPLQRPAMSGMIERQSALVAYIDSFHMLFIMCLVILPLLLFLRVKRASHA